MASIHSSPGARKFGEDPDLYDLARPPYPPGLFAWLRDGAALDAQSDCFEIGAGTGHATLPVLATPVRYLLAIEPDARLARRLREKAGDDPRLVIETCRFETARLPQAHFDLGFAATSMHWLRRSRALAKAKAALKAGGAFAMWWHVYDDPVRPDAFARATAHLFSGLEQDPRATAGAGAFALDAGARCGELRSAGFADIEHRVFDQELVFTPETVSALYATFSRVRMAPEAARGRLLSDVERIAQEEFGGAVARLVRCSAFMGRRP